MNNSVISIIKHLFNIINNYKGSKVLGACKEPKAVFWEDCKNTVPKGKQSKNISIVRFYYSIVGP